MSKTPTKILQLIVWRMENEYPEIRHRGRNASLRDERILVPVEGTKPRERSNKKRY